MMWWNVIPMKHLCAFIWSSSQKNAFLSYCSFNIHLKQLLSEFVINYFFGCQCLCIYVEELFAWRSVSYHHMYNLINAINEHEQTFPETVFLLNFFLFIMQKFLIKLTLIMYACVVWVCVHKINHLHLFSCNLYRLLLFLVKVTSCSCLILSYVIISSTSFYFKLFLCISYTCKYIKLTFVV